MTSRDGPEQDEVGGDALPTYEDLAERHGADSRFGRWRSWIEKRAAERYADITPEELERRRMRGWGDSVIEDNAAPVYDSPSAGGSPSVNVDATTASVRTSMVAERPRLSVQSLMKDLPEIAPDSEFDEYSFEPQPLLGQVLEPTHLTVSHFGSRFLPHTTSPIRCLLPVIGDRLLLVGHDDGLSVLNMFPQDWGEDGLVSNGPTEAQAHLIWQGEGVFQMTLLEMESTGDGIPQGVVLVLVGGDIESKPDDHPRTLRMYNLISLISLAKWAVATKGANPLQLGDRATSCSPQQSSSKLRQRASSSLARGIKSLISDSPLQQSPDPSLSYDHYQPDGGRTPTRGSVSVGSRRSTADSSWDILNVSLPLRWATDFVSLSSAGSRLANTSVITYSIWCDNTQLRGNTMLAVATKYSILLYESPKGERAFRFLKDFYTPVTPREIKFVQQSPPDSVSRSPSSVSSTKRSRHNKHASTISLPAQTGHLLCLFIVFEKKAGVIRLGDASVGEVEMYDDTASIMSSHLEPNTPPFATSSSSPRHNRRSRGSSDGFAFLKENKASWILPAEVNLPIAPQVSQAIYCLTRGKKTHVLPDPLPADIQAMPPLKILTWQAIPTHLACRVIRPVEFDRRPYLQFIASSQDGIEIQELSVTSILDRKEKGRAEEPLHAVSEFVGDTGLLCPGGHWDRPYDSPLSRSYSTNSTMSFDSTDTAALRLQLQKDQGLYGWQRRGLEDWRIIWVGGSGAERREED